MRVLSRARGIGRVAGSAAWLVLVAAPGCRGTSLGLVDADGSHFDAAASDSAADHHVDTAKDLDAIISSTDVGDRDTAGEPSSDGDARADIVSDASNATIDASADDRMDLADVADAADAANPDGLSQDVSASDARTSPWNYVFVTSSTYGTTLQPLEAADDNCNLAARAAQLPGTYRAWLATANVPAPDRLQGARGWIRVDGVPFADTIADIVNGRIFNPPRVDEYGNDLGATDSWQVMTGTNSDGIDVPGQDCEGWTNSAASVYQAVGDLRATTQIWTSGGAVQCNETVRMYCFGVDKQQPLTTTSVVGKRAFISDGSFRASGGLSAADQECADEAAASLLSGTFKALLATSTASAASRFTSSPSTIWVRVDGMPLNAPGTDIMDGGQLLTPLNVSSTRAYVGNVGVYTGASTPREVPMVSSSCDDWQQPSTADLVIIGAVTHTVSWFREFASPCNLFSSGQVRIYCLEQ